MANLATLYHLAKFASGHPIAGRNKTQALMRFLRWQLASRTIGQPIVLPFVGSTRLIISKAMPGAAGNYYYGLPEVEEVAMALHFLRPGELMGDIGANIGALSVAVAGVTEARVVAMEPVPSTYRALCDNIAINHLHDRVQPHAAGAGETEAVLRFTTDRGGSDRIVTDPHAAGQPVAVRSLDQVFTETPDMLVLDVEGFEPAVIKGASRLLADQRLKIIIAETMGFARAYGLDDAGMHASLLQRGFGTYRYEPARRQLQPTEGMGAVNTIYVRDRDHVAQRLRDAPAFQVAGHAF
jgi:FkbM family methyltransferase